MNIQSAITQSSQTNRSVTIQIDSKSDPRVDELITEADDYVWVKTQDGAPRLDAWAYDWRVYLDCPA